MRKPAAASGEVTLQSSSPALRARKRTSKGDEQPVVGVDSMAFPSLASPTGANACIPASLKHIGSQRTFADVQSLIIGKAAGIQCYQKRDILRIMIYSSRCFRRGSASGYLFGPVLL